MQPKKKANLKIQILIIYNIKIICYNHYLATCKVEETQL